MNLLNGYILPHPPLLVVGSEEEKNKLSATLSAFDTVASEIENSGAELVVLITPHGPLFVDGLCVYGSPKIVGNFSSFGHKEITGVWDNDITFIDGLYKKAQESQIPFVKLDPQIVKEFDLSSELDHGAMVPLKLLEKSLKGKKVVVINYGLMPVDTLYRFGQLLTETIIDQQKKTVIIASGDLSHYLSESGPYGYREEGVHFDHQYVKSFNEDEWKNLLFVEPKLLEQAGECGKRSIEILLGAFDGQAYEPEKLVYESPFGVGYLVGRLKALGISTESRLSYILEQQQQILVERIALESSVVSLARQGIQKYLETEQTLRPKETLEIEESGQRFGVFVSLKDAGGLRGCMGSTGGIAPTVEEEIVEMAIKAATRDPRFEEIDRDELDRITISVDILSKSQQVIDKKELDPTKYGVIVKSNHKQGLLLPNLEGIETVKDQISIVLNKAGIEPLEEEYQLYKFTVKRFY